MISNGNTGELFSITCIGLYAHAQLALMELGLELGEQEQLLNLIPKLKNIKVCSHSSKFQVRNLYKFNVYFFITFRLTKL